MRPCCDKHRIPLRRTHLPSGKVLWLCRYSHKPHFQTQRQAPACRRCKRPGVYSEGLCYPCWYYR